MGSRIGDCGLRIAGWLVAAAILCAVPVIALAEETALERAERLKNMTAEQKDALDDKLERFEKLSEEEQERLRELHVSIQSAPNGADLRQTLSRYHAWLATLTSGQRSELLTMPADQRIERIKELLKQQESQRFQAFVGNLPPEDHTTIFNWLGEFVSEHEAEILNQLDFSERSRVRNAPDREAKNRLLALYMAAKRQNPKMPTPSVDDLNRLMERVSTEATRQIEQAPAEQQPERIREMVRAAIFSRRLPPVEDEELQKFYTGLPADRREWLEGLEGEEFRRRLTWMYHAEKGGYRGQGRPWLGGFGPPGPGGSHGRPNEGIGPRGDGPRGGGDGRRGDGRPGERGGPPGERRPKGPPPDELPPEDRPPPPLPEESASPPPDESPSDS